MLSVLIWFLMISLLGWVSFPIAFKVLRKLPSRGFILSKAVGLLLWGFFFWILVSLGLLQNDLAGQLVAFLILISLSIWAGWGDKFAGIKGWIKANWRLILATETLFLLTFAIWAFIRSANPAIYGTEKPMEMAFITSILRSPSFPPNDPWLSGYGISYYYFGYVMIAMLIRLSGVSAGVGYNLSSALWFALTAVSAYSVLFDMVKIRWLNKTREHESATPKWLYVAALLAPFMLLIVSNWHGFVDILHSRGLFWTTGVDGSQISGFWSWLNLKELDTAPTGTLSWLPTRPGGVQWWAASRVLQDFKLDQSAIEVIDEFPFFSYLLSDLHPHVLGMPFVLLVISQALNLFWGGMAGSARLFKWRLPFHWPGLFLAIISLGGLAFLNTWDFPFYLALMAAAYMVERAHNLGWGIQRLREFVLIMAGLGIPAILAYLPFFLSFSSQAGGIYPSLIFYTRGVYFWVMFGPLLVPILIFAVYEWVKHRRGRQWRVSLLITFGLIGLLFLLCWGLSYIASRIPELSSLFLWLQGGEEVGIFGLMWQAILERLQDPGTWLTLAILIFLCMGLLIKSRQKDQAAIEGGEYVYRSINPSTLFVLILVLLGAVLTIVPEFVYLRDQFSVRMNTIFKFYFQAWILWSLAASYAIIVLWRKSKKFSSVVRILLGVATILGVVVFVLSIKAQGDSGSEVVLFEQLFQEPQFGSRLTDWLILGIAVIILAILVYSLVTKKWMWSLKVLILLGVGMGLVYPATALWSKTGGFKPFDGFTLDGTQYYRQVWPDQMKAVDWLESAPMGVLVEAVSPTGGSYTTYASVSTFSGMPTVLGWVGHEQQWRGGGEEVGSRQADVEVLYSTSSWEEAGRIIDMYNIRYIYIGELERKTYAINEEKFEMHLQTVFDSPNAVIYEVPQGSGN
jgi:YYY domain-containing protein